MPATLDEQTQFVDSAGKPLVNGKVYFGVQNADPVLNPVSIFSDRALSVAIANPQLLDALGRTANKVWVAGRYSMRVDDLNDVQIYQELDNGESPDVGVTALENVTGGNDIVAEASSTITAYEDQEQYTLRIVQTNTDDVTLDIDGVGQTPVLKNHDEQIQPGNFEAGQIVIVTRNGTDDTFEWTNQNIKAASSYKGTDIADSAAPTVPTDGSYFEALGTTTRTSYVVAANRIWSEKTIGARTYTAGAPIVTLDGNDLVLLANQTVVFQSTAANIVQVISVGAAAGLPKAYLTGMTLSNGTDADHDIDITIGETRGNADVVDIALAAAFGKQIDASWVAGGTPGTPLGGLSSSLTVAVDTWYHVHAIKVGGNADIGFDTSVTAANLVADHSATAFRRIGSVLTDAAANIIAFTQTADFFRWETRATDFNNAAPGTSAISVTLSTPIDVVTNAQLQCLMQDGGNNLVLVTSLTDTDTAPTTAFHTLRAAAASQLPSAEILVPTNTSSQIRTRMSETTTTQNIIQTIGWYDDRGESS